MNDSCKIGSKCDDKTNNIKHDTNAKSNLVITINLGGRPFQLDVGGQAFLRRSLYFLHKKGSITKNDQDILDAIGIDSHMEDMLKRYLPQFFERLPNCQSYSSMYLSKQCEIPYFVIWVSKFAERTRSKERIDEHKQLKVISDYNTAVDKTIVNSLHGKLTDIDQLFALIRIPNI